VSRRLLLRHRPPLTRSGAFCSGGFISRPFFFAPFPQWQKIPNNFSQHTIPLDSRTRNLYIVLHELVSAASAPNARQTKRSPFMKKKSKKNDKKAPKKAK